MSYPRRGAPRRKPAPLGRGYNGTIWTWNHPGVGTVRQARPPIRYGVTDTELHGSVPLLGEHTDTVLASLGRSADDIAALRTAGVVA